MKNKPEDHAEQHIEHEVCDAIRLLCMGGWRIRRLMLTFEYGSENGIERHIYNSCSHNNKVCSAGQRYSEDKSDFIDNIKHQDYWARNGRINSFECAAMTLLYSVGWTYKKIARFIEINSNRMKHHIKNQCHHEKVIEIDWVNYENRVLEYTPVTPLRLTGNN